LYCCRRRRRRRHRRLALVTGYRRTSKRERETNEAERETEIEIRRRDYMNYYYCASMIVRKRVHPYNYDLEQQLTTAVLS